MHERQTPPFARPGGHGHRRSSLRFGFSSLNTMGEAFAAAVMVKRAVEKLRRVQGSGVGPVQVYCT